MPDTDNFVDPYARSLAAQNALLQQLQQSQQARFTPEQIAEREAENRRMLQLGILGQLSGDAAAGNVGSAVYKSAQADRTPRVTDMGAYDPISGTFALHPEVKRQREEAVRDKLEDKSAAAFQQWQQNRQRAQERREDADAQRTWQGSQNAAMRGVLGGGPLVQAIDPNTGQPVFVPRNQAVGMTPASGGTITEGERKAATLLKRLEFSQGQMASVIAKHPEAASPVASAEYAGHIPLVGEAAANALVSGPRQQVENAQLDILDAALTLGTGAAYTREQLKGYAKSYFPQLNDEPQTKFDKAARLENVIEAARIAAGRAPGGTAGTQPNASNAPRALPNAIAAQQRGGPAGAPAAQKPVRVNY